MLHFNIIVMIRQVLCLLEGESTKPANVSKDSAQIPNLIDTEITDSYLKTANPFDDLLGDDIISNIESQQLKTDVDPFSDVSFNTEQPETAGREIPNLDDIQKLMSGLSINGDLISLVGSQEFANGTFTNGEVSNTTMFNPKFVSPAVNYSNTGNSCNHHQQEETQAFDFIAVSS